MAGGAPIVAGRGVVDEEPIEVHRRIVDSEQRRGFWVLCEKNEQGLVCRCI
jgi:hypothetical protein